MRLHSTTYDFCSTFEPAVITNHMQLNQLVQCFLNSLNLSAKFYNYILPIHVGRDLVVILNENHLINILFNITEILKYTNKFKYHQIANFDKNIDFWKIAILSHKVEFLSHIFVMMLQGWMVS